MSLPTLEESNAQNAQQETEPVQDQFVSHIQTPIAQSASMVEPSSSSPAINEAVDVPDDVSTQPETDKIAPIQLMASQSKAGEPTEKNKNTANSVHKGRDLYRDFPQIDSNDMLPKDVKQAQEDFRYIGRVKVTNTVEAPWLVAVITWYFSHQRLIRVMNGNSENLSALQIGKLRNRVKQYRERVLQAQQLLKPDAFQVLLTAIRAELPDTSQKLILKEFDRRKTQMLRYLECLEPKCEGDLQKLIENGFGRLKGGPNDLNLTIDLPDPSPAKKARKVKKGQKADAKASSNTDIHSSPPAIISITSSLPNREELKRRIESQEKELELRNQELESLRKQLRTLEAGNLAPNN